MAVNKRPAWGEAGLVTRNGWTSNLSLRLGVGFDDGFFQVVVFGVEFGGFAVVVLGVRVVGVRQMGMMAGLFVVTGFVGVSGGMVVMGGLLVVTGGFAMVLNGIFVRHGRAGMVGETGGWSRSWGRRQLTRGVRHSRGNPVKMRRFFSVALKRHGLGSIFRSVDEFAWRRRGWKRAQQDCAPTYARLAHRRCSGGFLGLTKRKRLGPKTISFFSRRPRKKLRMAIFKIMKRMTNVTKPGSVMVHGVAVAGAGLGAGAALATAEVMKKKTAATRWENVTRMTQSTPKTALKARMSWTEIGLRLSSGAVS